ncbi:hypothetical protein [Variovorax sp. OV329]|uniref:hypothetical protein n=1 Tax=Variovorax sp. OV329 TaxID=1882825 RepID=UPI0008F0A7F1|nr:hypothetical protein [Variovorax sp. OV329]SFM81381.1 hypothetical protein SAMN05444747_10952 [Variovorax sp. OV329]
MPIELWPPLSVIRSHLEPGAQPGAPDPADDAASRQGMPTALPEGGSLIDLQMPLAELARRRQVLAARNFNARWEPGRIVSVLHEGRLLGVLLDKKLPGSERWQGFMAASEADWAGAHDVLLEPTDEPFEPLFGLIQAWNPISLSPLPQQVARVQGEVSATRMAAIRAVHDEHVNGTPLPIDPEPGHIALRSVGGGNFSVLSGTPLGPDDVRAPYQQLYRDAAARLSASVPATPPAALWAPLPPAASSAAVPRADDGAAQGGSLGGRLRRWFGADAWARPALAVLALVVVVQNVALWGGRDAAQSSEDEVRFRAVPVAPAGASADLGVVWRPGVTVQDSIRLLRAIDADVVAGPDERGIWYLRVPDVKESTTALSASPLVAAVGPP